ncbi:MAG: CotH kinase family protein, partial [Bacteroidota bacterium]
FAAWNPVLNFPQISRMSILKPDSVPYKGDRPLLDRTIVQNRYLREKYLQMVDNLLLNDLMPDRINSTIDSLKQRIRTAVYADVNKMYSNTDFDTNFESTIGDPMDPGNFIPGLKVYMNERRIHVEQELEELRKKED